MINESSHENASAEKEKQGGHDNSDQSKQTFQNTKQANTNLQNNNCINMTSNENFLTTT